MVLRGALLELIHKQVSPAMGCTEPVAVALASAYATQAVGGKVKRIAVKTDPNIFKNGMGVYVPNTGKVGLNIAAAIGAIGGNPQSGLEVLKDITKEHKQQMEELIDSGNVEVDVLGEPGLLHVIAEVETDKGIGSAEIIGKHDRLVRLEANSNVLYEIPCTKQQKSNDLQDFVFKHSIAEILNTIESYSEEELSFLLDGALMNYRVAKAGMETAAGLGVGAKMHDLINKGLIGNDLINVVAMYTAAASDARMQGMPLPVMTTNCSGNQGIVATVAVYIAACELNIKGISLLRALAISQVLTIMVKNSIGLLSALCSCTIAAPIGAAAGVIYLSGGSAKDICEVVRSLTADITGAICDGAKPGCALKVASGVATAIRHSLMVLEGLSVPATNGIVGRTAEECISNIGVISNPGMVNTDKSILDIMIQKSK